MFIFLIFFLKLSFSLSPQHVDLSSFCDDTEISSPHRVVYSVNEINQMNLSEFLVYLAHQGDVSQMTEDRRQSFRRLFWGLIYHQDPKVEQAILTEIVDNAVDATKKETSSRVTVQLGLHVFRVFNDSKGLSFQELGSMFSPYWSSKQSHQDIGRFGQGLKMAFFLLRTDQDFLKMSFFNRDTGKRVLIVFRVKEGTIVSPSHALYLDNIEVSVTETEVEENDRWTMVEVSSQLISGKYENRLKNDLENRYQCYSFLDSPSIFLEDLGSKQGENGSSPSVLYSSRLGLTDSSVLLEDSSSEQPQWKLETFSSPNLLSGCVFVVNGRVIFQTLSSARIILHLPPTVVLETTKDGIVVNQVLYDIFFSLFDQICIAIRSGRKELKDTLLDIQKILFFLSSDSQFLELYFSILSYIECKYPDIVGVEKSVPTVDTLALSNNSLSTLFQNQLDFVLKKAPSLKKKLDQDLFFSYLFKQVRSDFIFSEENLSSEKCYQVYMSPFFHRVCARIMCVFFHLVEGNSEVENKDIEVLKFWNYQMRFRISISCVFDEFIEVSEDPILSFLRGMKNFFQSKSNLFQNKRSDFEEKEKYHRSSRFLYGETPTHSVSLQELSYSSSIKEEIEYLNSFLKPLSELDEIRTFYGDNQIVFNKLKNLGSLHLEPIDAISEIISNSMEAQATQVQIESGQLEGRTIIKIEDNGVGIEDPLAVLVPFRTTKPLEEGTNFGWGIYQSLSVFNDIMILSYANGFKVSIYLSRQSTGEISYSYFKEKLLEDRPSGTEVYLMMNRYDPRMSSFYLAESFHHCFPVLPSKLQSLSWKGSDLFRGRKVYYLIVEAVFFHLKIFSDIPQIIEHKDEIFSLLENEGLLFKGYFVQEISPVELAQKIENVVGSFTVSQRHILVLRLKELLSLRRTFMRTNLDEGFISRSGVVSSRFPSYLKRRLSYRYKEPQESLPHYLRHYGYSENRSLIIDYSSLSPKKIEGSEVQLLSLDIEDFPKDRVCQFFDLFEQISSKEESFLNLSVQNLELAEALVPFFLDVELKCVLPSIFFQDWSLIQSWISKSLFLKRAIYAYIKDRIKKMSSVRSKSQIFVSEPVPFELNNFAFGGLQAQLLTNLDSVLLSGDQCIIQFIERLKKYEMYITDWLSLKKKLAQFLALHVYSAGDEGCFYQFMLYYFSHGESSSRRNASQVKNYVSGILSLVENKLLEYLDLYWYYFSDFKNRRLVNGLDFLNSQCHRNIYSSIEVKGFVDEFEKQFLIPLKTVSDERDLVDNIQKDQNFFELNSDIWADQIRKKYPFFYQSDLTNWQAKNREEKAIVSLDSDQEVVEDVVPTMDESREVIGDNETIPVSFEREQTEVFLEPLGRYQNLSQKKFGFFTLRPYFSLGQNKKKPAFFSISKNA